MLWNYTAGSLACKMNHFVQNKSKAKRALEE